MRTLALTLAAAGALTLAGSNAHAVIVAAEYHPSSASQGNGILGDTMIAQTFLAEESGPLNRIGMAINYGGTPTHPVTLELRNVVDDRPGPVVLASSTLPASEIVRADFNDIVFTFFDFSGDLIPIVQGTQYAVAASTTNPEFGYTIMARSDKEYPDGGGFGSSDGGTTWLGFGGSPPILDHAFSVRLIPEPASLGLLGLGGLLVFRRRR
jgi:hypothetical protein